MSVFIQENFFFLFLLLFSFFSYIRYTFASRNLFLMSLFFFPATFLHELSHFITGLITFAMPTSFNIWPKKENGEYILGNVTFKNIVFFNALIVGIAPVLLIVLLYFIDKNNFEIYLKTVDLLFGTGKNFNIASFCLFVYINYILVYSGIPSTQDFKVILSHKFGLLFWLLIFFCCFFFFLNDGQIAIKNFFK